MPTRVLVAYMLMLLLVAGAVWLVWRANYYSERNVRRRARHARRERYQAQLLKNQAEEAHEDGG